MMSRPGDARVIAARAALAAAGGGGGGGGGGGVPLAVVPVAAAAPAAPAAAAPRAYRVEEGTGAGTQEEILDAAASGDMGTLRRLLTPAAARLRFGREVFGVAAGNGQIEAMEWLAAQGAAAPGASMNSALNSAALMGFDRAVKFLLARGAQVSVDTIRYAAGNGGAMVLDRLLARGEHANVALLGAASAGAVPCVQVALAHGASNLAEALRGAVEYEHAEVAVLLSEMGAVLPEPEAPVAPAKFLALAPKDVRREVLRDKLTLAKPEDTLCSICLLTKEEVGTKFVAVGFVVARCGHQFHRACLKANVRGAGDVECARGRCPLCRVPLLVFHAGEVNSQEEAVNSQ